MSSSGHYGDRGNSEVPGPSIEVLKKVMIEDEKYRVRMVKIRKHLIERFIDCDCEICKILEDERFTFNRVFGKK